jgi:Xaa-Pro aminopeptidase
MHGWTHLNVPLGVVDDVRAALGATWVDATPLLWEARLIKSPPELEYGRAAVRALDQAFAATFSVVEPGMSEAQIARLIRGNIMLSGGDHEAFTFVAADVDRDRSVGAAPGAARVQAGSIMYIDAGADVHGYRSDYNRLAVIGAPTAAQERAYDLVFRAYSAGFDAIRPGVKVGDVARTMLAILAEGGGHVAPLGAVGHGIGVELPEPPYLHPEASLELAEGMTLTIEPNVSFAGVGRMIVEDVVVVTAEGAQHLSEAPTRHELIRL